LDRVLEERLRQQPARLVHRGDSSAILVTGRPVNHVLHLLITVLTCGLWLIPWLVESWVGGERTIVLTLDDSGHVTIDRGRTQSSGHVRWVRVAAAIVIVTGLVGTFFGRAGLMAGVLLIALGVVAFVVDVRLYGIGASVPQTEQVA
jgi:hypothetical protein